MMVDPVTALDPAVEIREARDRAEVNRDQFLQILVTELTNQSPLDPLDNAQFMQQLVGLQTLEQTSALTDALKTFERFMQMTSASGLIGRAVRGIDAAGDPVEGVVSRVVLEGDTVLLKVGAHDVPINGVREIV